MYLAMTAASGNCLHESLDQKLFSRLHLHAFTALQAVDLVVLFHLNENVFLDLNDWIHETSMQLHSQLPKRDRDPVFCT